MKRYAIAALGLLLCLAFAGMDTVQAQAKAVVKIEWMSPDRLIKLGYQAHPTGADSIATGLRQVGVGTLVWLSAWDISGDTAFKPASSYNWTFISQAGTATFSSPTAQWTTFRPDVAGDYIVQVDIGGSTARDTIFARTFVGTDRNNTGASTNCKTCHSSWTQYTQWEATGHAQMFEKGMNGLNGSYWGEQCFFCHTTGYNKTATNGGFDDVAATAGFLQADWKPWRAGLYDSLLTTTKKTIAPVAGITCENCHGPLNFNHAGNPNVFQASKMDFGLCGSCHDEEPYHKIVKQYEMSAHSESVYESGFGSNGSSVISSYGLSTCTRCHDGSAFVQFVKGETFDNRKSTGYDIAKHTKITCQTCHDPHTATLRSTPLTSDTLGNGYNYSSDGFGAGKVCVNCHKYRRNGGTYPNVTNIGSTFGPHHRGAADLLLGRNAYEYGQTPPPMARPGMHFTLTSSGGTCKVCHMASDTSSFLDATIRNKDLTGNHSWNIEHSDGVNAYDNVTACRTCHTSMTSISNFQASSDYDADGTTEAYVHEIEGLMEKVAMALPPVGSPTVDWTQIRGNPDSVKFKRAYYNYRFVEEGGDNGIHNPVYTVWLLQLTASQLTGIEFVNGEVPAQFELAQNYPNPFNPTTEITFALPKAAPVMLEIYDLTGRVVATLVNQDLAAGTHKVTWNAKNSNGESLASGVYLYRISAGDFVAAKKMVLVK